MNISMGVMQSPATSAQSVQVARKRSGVLLAAMVLALIGAGWQHPVQAAARDQAKRIHDRLTGTPPSDTLLTQMTSMVQAGNAIGAARLAIDPSNAESKGFYSVTLKNFATPWTNRDRTVFAPLNDYTATVIGMVRDNVPFNTLLSADLLYTGSTSGAPAYSALNNNHYQYLEDRDIDLRTALVSQNQSSLTGIPATATAGVITSRAAAQAFFIDGTNRAMFRYTLLNHLCNDMEQVQDTSRPPDRIRQDVSRSPGGDSRLFLNGCVGCHSGMDPMAQAFAYYDFDETQGRLVYTGGVVQQKYGINIDNFKPGYVTPDDHWNNRWREGPNKVLGFTGATGAGTGAKSLGQELGNSDAFAQCQVKKAFKAVCLRDPGNSADRSEVAQITSTFKSNYSMREVFAEAAVYCMGD
ncbi:MAG: hypothetical protein QM808_03415 [Steroidobacteraceae bacterium]